MSKNLPMAIDASIPFNQCQFKLFPVDNKSLFCRDLLVEINHKLIESTIAYFLGLDITEVEKLAVANIDLKYAYARNRMFGLTLEQVQHLFTTTHNPTANKYKPILSELILTQVLPLFNQQPKHDDFKKEIDVNIIATNQPLTMSSLEIAELCDKQHKNVIADIKNMFEQLEINSAEFSAQYKDSTGRTLPCFNLNKELSLTLVAGYNVKLRHKIILRWQELETNTPALPNFADPAEAAIAWANQYKEKQALENKLQEAKPLIGFAETVQKADGGILVNALAHLAQNEHDIKIGEKRLWKWLRMMGLIQQSKPLPTQKGQDLGLFVVQPRMIAHHSGMQEHFTTKVTGKGQIYIIDKLKEFFSKGGNTCPSI